jgi:integrase
MAALGDRPAADVTTRDINVLLAQVASRRASPRTVNKHRQLVCAIYSYGCQEATFSLAHNPAIAADRRPEPEPGRLDFFSPEEVEALARALAAGLHRDPDAPAVSDEEAIARADDDRQDAELVRVAAYMPLEHRQRSRPGERVVVRLRARTQLGARMRTIMAFVDDRLPLSPHRLTRKRVVERLANQRDRTSAPRIVPG